MSQPELTRVRADLETLRVALGDKRPFDWADVHANLWIAALGLLLAVWPLLVPWQSRWTLAVPLGLMALVTIRRAAQARRRRGPSPSHWREQRLNLIAALIVAPAAAGYILWERWIGLPRSAAGAAAVFFVGLGMLLIGVVDRRRLPYVGGAIPVMAFGLAIPFCTPPQVVSVGGICIALGCALTAAIISRQLRSAGVADASN